MLSVTFKCIMLNAVMLNVIILNVVPPITHLSLVSPIQVSALPNVVLIKTSSASVRMLTTYPPAFVQADVAAPKLP
jgi:hypothetical protein